MMTSSLLVARKIEAKDCPVSPVWPTSETNAQFAAFKREADARRRAVPRTAAARSAGRPSHARAIDQILGLTKSNLRPSLQAS
jgi:hypothetical protein